MHLHAQLPLAEPARLFLTPLEVRTRPCFRQVPAPILGELVQLTALSSGVQVEALRAIVPHLEERQVAEFTQTGPNLRPRRRICRGHSVRCLDILSLTNCQAGYFP